MTIIALTAAISIGSNTTDMVRTFAKKVPEGFELTDLTMLVIAGEIADRYTDAGQVSVSDLTAIPFDQADAPIMLGA